jgi:hypothetical protein
MPESEMRNEWGDYTPEIVDRYCNDENLSKITADLPQFDQPRRSTGFMAWMGLLLANIMLGGISLWIYNKHLSFK